MSNVEDFASYQNARIERVANISSPLKGGGSDGTYDDMETRVKRLEDDGKEVRGDLKTILRDVAEIKGRVNAMPSTWQMIGLIVAIAVAMFTIIRITLPI